MISLSDLARLIGQIDGRASHRVVSIIHFYDAPIVIRYGAPSSIPVHWSLLPNARASSTADARIPGKAFRDEQRSEA